MALRSRITFFPPQEEDTIISMIEVMAKETNKTQEELRVMQNKLILGGNVFLTNRNFSNGFISFLDIIYDLGVQFKLVTETFNLPPLQVKDSVVIDTPGLEYDGFEGIVVNNSDAEDIRVYLFSRDEIVTSFERSELRLKDETGEVKFSLFDKVLVDLPDDIYDGDKGIVVDSNEDECLVCIFLDNDEADVLWYASKELQLCGN